MAKSRDNVGGRESFEIESRPYKLKYQTILVLGSGSFGTVYLAKSKAVDKSYNDERVIEGTMMERLVDSHIHSKTLVAVKVMNKVLQDPNDYMRVKEVRFILHVALHPCLVQIFDLFVDQETLKLHIVMEEMNQNLYQLMKARRRQLFLPVTLRSILRQLADGIRHIHKHGFFHRDLKPENILVMLTAQYYGLTLNIPPFREDDNYVVKIADYGLARHYQNTSQYTSYISTRWYRLPEILLRRKRYLMPVDIWAFAVVAVEIATFRPLFPGANELDQTWKILSVLGSPNKKIEPDPESIPLGGLWFEAEVLANKLGFSLPKTSGLKVEDILPKTLTHLKELSEIIKRCLTWNPDSRASITWICSRPYFRDTLVLQPNQDARYLGSSVDNDENIYPSQLSPAPKNYEGYLNSPKGVSPMRLSLARKSPVQYRYVSPGNFSTSGHTDSAMTVNSVLKNSQDYEGVFSTFGIGELDQMYYLGGHDYDENGGSDLDEESEPNGVDLVVDTEGYMGEPLDLFLEEAGRYLNFEKCITHSGEDEEEDEVEEEEEEENGEKLAEEFAEELTGEVVNDVSFSSVHKVAC